MIEFFASFFIWFLFLGLGILWVIDGKIKKEQVVHALVACLVAWVIAFLIKHFFPTTRPFLLNGREIDVLMRPTDGAFPSEHTTLAFALAVTIYMHDKKVGWIFFDFSGSCGNCARFGKRALPGRYSRRRILGNDCCSGY